MTVIMVGRSLNLDHWLIPEADGNYQKFSLNTWNSSNDFRNAVGIYGIILFESFLGSQVLFKDHFFHEWLRKLGMLCKLAALLEIEDVLCR